MVINVFGTKISYSILESLLSSVYCVLERMIFFWICFTVVWNKNVSFQYPNVMWLVSILMPFLFFWHKRAPTVITPPGFIVPNEVSLKPSVAADSNFRNCHFTPNYKWDRCTKHYKYFNGCYLEPSCLNILSVLVNVKKHNASELG